MYVGIEAIEPTYCNSSQDNGFQARILRKDELIPVPGCRRHQDRSLFRLSGQNKNDMKFSNFLPSLLGSFLYLGKNARVATLTCTQEERDDDDGKKKRIFRLRGIG